MLFVLLSNNGKSQAPQLHGWHITKAELILDNRWRLFLDDQVRSQRLLQKFNLHAFSLAVSFRPSNGVALMIGAGEFYNYSDGGNFKSPLLGKEKRLYEQVEFTKSICRLQLEQRFRLEHRWFERNYQNRFRTRFAGTAALNKAAMEKGTLYATAYDELFFSNQKTGLEMNRLQVGCGYQWSASAKLLIAWVWQSIYPQNKIVMRTDFLQTTVSFRLRGAGS